MKRLQTLTFLFIAIQLMTARPVAGTDYLEGTIHIETKPVATVVKGKVKINYEALSKKSAGGHEVLGYRILYSKDKKFVFLVQQFKTVKSKVNRYIPLERKGSDLLVDLKNEADWIDCWLMRCSTCEEVVSQTGGVWCECSNGGCGRADTSEPIRDIAEQLFA